MYALIMTAMLLIIYPIGSIGEGLGGPAIAFGVVAAASVSAAIPALASRPKQLEKMIIEDGEPPPNHVRSEMWKNLLRIYLAYMLGSAAGIIVGLQLGKELRMAGFIVVALMTVQILRQLLLKVPKRVYPAAANSGFRSQMVSGILSWGIPVAILAGGFSIMLAWGRPEAVAVGVGTALLFAVPGGAFFGGWIYLIRRVTTRRSASST
jgi:hypothetical protein